MITLRLSNWPGEPADEALVQDTLRAVAADLHNGTSDENVAIIVGDTLIFGAISEDGTIEILDCQIRRVGTVELGNATTPVGLA